MYDGLITNTHDIRAFRVAERMSLDTASMFFPTKKSDSFATESTHSHQGEKEIVKSIYNESETSKNIQFENYLPTIKNFNRPLLARKDERDDRSATSSSLPTSVPRQIRYFPTDPINFHVLHLALIWPKQDEIPNSP